MTVSPFSIPKRVWFTALIGSAILLVGLFLINHLHYPKKDIAATAFLLDMVITFPVIYYFMVIRPLKLRKWSIILVFSICCIVAYFILPQHQQTYIIQIRKLTVVIELAALAYGLLKIRKVRAEYKVLQASFPDIAYNMYKSMATVFGDKMYVKIIASELTILRFGLLCWKKQKQLHLEATHYTVYKESGYPVLFGVILFACMVEITGLHILLLHYSKVAAAVVSVLSLYGTIFIVSDLSAILKSPVLVTDDKLLLRTGLRWRASVNKNNILSVEKIKEGFQPETNCFKGSILKNNANILFTFKHTVIIERLYRKSISADKIVMSIDQADDFIADLSNDLNQNIALAQ
jgi:hypothetical protein